MTHFGTRCPLPVATETRGIPVRRVGESLRGPWKFGWLVALAGPCVAPARPFKVETDAAIFRCTALRPASALCQLDCHLLFSGPGASQTCPNLPQKVSGQQYKWSGEAQSCKFDLVNMFRHFPWKNLSLTAGQTVAALI